MLDERNKQVLCAVIQCYINSPGPVGSRIVTKKYSFGLSPATIRNIMSDLEDMGFLHQPHTSAGRVPTDSGYRFYVDTLSASKQCFNKELLLEIFKKLEMLKKDINSFPDETSKMLSSLSHYIGITMSPNPSMTTLAKIELTKYRKNQLAVILFTGEGIIHNKIVSIESDISQKDLNRIVDYINSEYTGSTLHEIRKRIIKEIAKDKVLCDKLISETIRICKYVFSISPGTVYISGLADMLELPDFCNINRIKDLLKTLDDKSIIVKLLDKISDFEGTQVFIGSENPIDEMKKLSMVISTYREGNRPVGAVGIIGPKRMNYLEAISLVDITATYITDMITNR